MQEDKPKRQPPSADEQKRLIANIDEIYKPGQAKDQAAKAALARKLLEEGRKHEANRAEQFVFFRRAGETACDASEADLMLEAVDAIVAAGFDIRPYQVKARLLKRLAEQRRLAALLSFRASRLLPEVRRRGRGQRCGRRGLRSARRGQKAPGQGDTAGTGGRARGKGRVGPRTHPGREGRAREEGRGGKRSWRRPNLRVGAGRMCQGPPADPPRARGGEAAQERLKTDPDDAGACLAVGRWYCFCQGDWDEGLKLMAKGSDAALKSLAAAELASKPSKADDRVARGDAWWDLAEKAAGKAKAAMRRRAGH